MRYWDSSAVVPLIISETASSRMKNLLEEDPAIATWWGTAIECASAIARRHRTGHLSSRAYSDSLGRMKRAQTEWAEIVPGDALRDHAVRVLRVHPLRAADAVHIAAALVLADLRPSSVEFVTLDARQGEAADIEGLRVVT